jgi:hypothetical protein
MKKQTLMTLVLMAITTTIFADCDDDTNNLVDTANCSFDINTTDWEWAGDFIDTNTDDFLSQGGSGSALVNSQLFGVTFIAQINQCVVASSDTAIKSGGAWIKLETGTDVNCQILHYLHSDNACNSVPRVGDCNSSLQSIDTTWTNHSCSSSILTAVPESIRLLVSCESTTDFTVKFDNVYIGQQGLLPVELQNFSID